MVCVHWVDVVVGLIIVDRRFGDVEGDLDVEVEAYRCVVTNDVPPEFNGVPPEFSEVPPEFNGVPTEFIEVPTGSLAPEFNVSSIFLVLRLSSSDSWDRESHNLGRSLPNNLP